MAQNKKIYRSNPIRSLPAIVMFGFYALSMLGTSALVLGASSTAALARGGGGGGHGGGGGRGFGGGFRGGGFGYGFYPGYYEGYYPSYEDETSCYVARQRVMTRRGWRVRRVEVCE